MLRSGGVILPVIFELKVIPVFINPIFETINTICFYNITESGKLFHF